MTVRTGMSKGIRLGTVATLVIGVIGALGVIASVALVETTAVLHKSSRQMLVAAESINAAQELEANVQLHSTESLLWELSGDPSHKELRDAARLGLKAWFSQIRKYADTPGEAGMVDEAEVVVDDYLAVRDRLESAGLSSEEIAKQIAKSTGDALSRLSALTARNVQEAKDDYAMAVKLDQRADLLGMVVVGLILLSIPTILVILDRLVFRPLKQMDRSLRDFGAGRPITPIETGVIEVQSVSSTLAQLAGQLQKQGESRVRYLAAIAHDLRNPISAIKMSAEILAQERINEPNGSSSETQTFLEVIQKQSTYLNRMVGDLLETTRVEAGQVELKIQPQDLRACVSDCVELFRLYSEAHPLRFMTSEAPVPCSFDAVRISQVVNNLISNAIKYSPFGGEILVKVEKRGDEAVIAVSDHGSGISPEDMAPIFEPFRRSQATRETIPGVGLGLHTARRLVQAHGGRIEVISELGVGSTFLVFLPCDEARHEHVGQMPRPSARSTTKHLH